MTEFDPLDPATGAAPAEKPTDARRTRGIRFSDSEWEEVKTAAERPGMPVAEFVRDRILEIARGGAAADSAAIPSELAPLIERTFRYVYMLATLRRDELVREGRGDKMEKLVKPPGSCRNRLLSVERAGPSSLPPIASLSPQDCRACKPFEETLEATCPTQSSILGRVIGRTAPIEVSSRMPLRKQFEGSTERTTSFTRHRGISHSTRIPRACPEARPSRTPSSARSKNARYSFPI